VEILAQSSTAFVLTHNFQGTQILGASCGRLSDSVASCTLLLFYFTALLLWCLLDVQCFHRGGRSLFIT